jgi:hypothetical protein
MRNLKLNGSLGRNSTGSVRNETVLRNYVFAAGIWSTDSWSTGGTCERMESACIRPCGKSCLEYHDLVCKFRLS